MNLSHYMHLQVANYNGFQALIQLFFGENMMYGRIYGGHSQFLQCYTNNKRKEHTEEASKELIPLVGLL
ncbi:hypothetical protein P8452_68748 [Trifolium repens]|nr:hypothetical protein P8452_68748 [Trifolium repens]